MFLVHQLLDFLLITFLTWSNTNPVIGQHKTTIERTRDSIRIWYWNWTADMYLVEWNTQEVLWSVWLVRGWILFRLSQKVVGSSNTTSPGLHPALPTSTKLYYTDRVWIPVKGGGKAGQEMGDQDVLGVCECWGDSSPFSLYSTPTLCQNGRGKCRPGWPPHVVVVVPFVPLIVTARVLCIDFSISTVLHHRL